MGRSASGVLVSAVLLLVATTAVIAMAQAPAPGEQTLPATDINRESNNPAKEAIKAREAQDKDRAAQEAVTEESPVALPGPIADSAQLVRSVEAALRNDPRTAILGIAVRLDEQNLIGLHGSVPSIESRTEVIAIATKVAGATRTKNNLVVTGE